MFLFCVICSFCIRIGEFYLIGFIFFDVSLNIVGVFIYK